MASRGGIPLIFGALPKSNSYQKILLITIPYIIYKVVTLILQGMLLLDFINSRPTYNYALKSTHHCYILEFAAGNTKGYFLFKFSV